jgi:hypothetical protein
MTNILGAHRPLNATMTRWPEIRQSDDMVEIHMDGRFLDVATQKIETTPNTVFPPRETLPQREQFFIH